MPMTVFSAFLHSLVAFAGALPRGRSGAARSGGRRQPLPDTPQVVFLVDHSGSMSDRAFGGVLRRAGTWSGSPCRNGSTTFPMAALVGIGNRRRHLRAPAGGVASRLRPRATSS